MSTGVRWRTVTLTTLLVFMFVLSLNVLLELPATDLDARGVDGVGRRRQQSHDEGVNPRQRRSRNVAARRRDVHAMRLFPDDEGEEDDDVIAGKNEPQPKAEAKRENALMLFEDEDVGAAAAGEAAEQRKGGAGSAGKAAASIAGEDLTAEERKRLLQNHHVDADRDAMELDGEHPGRKNGTSHNKEMEAALRNKNNNNNNSILLENVHALGQIVKKMKHNDKNSPEKILKPHPFKAVINSPKLCADEDIFLLAYVHTAPDHYKRRTVIRHTWGDASQYDVTMRVVFVMGVVGGNVTGADVTQKALIFEAEQYGDIVQEDFIDTYHNLTHKGVAALRWIDVYCSHAKFVLKSDDDIFVNTFTLFRVLKKLQRTVPQPKGFIMCLVWTGMPVQRTGKWMVSREEWPDDWYPTYCSGSAFVLSTDAAVSMHRISYQVPFFWVDDFYISGLLPLKLGNITHRPFASAYVLNGDKLEEMFTGPSWFLYVFSHVHNLNRIQAVWDTVVQLASGKIKPVIRTRVAQ